MNKKPSTGRKSRWSGHITREGEQVNSARKAVTVKASPNAAWQMFTEQMGTWWSLAVRRCAIYKIGKAKSADVVIAPRIGDRQDTNELG
jgi:hypothetical protein